jgi:GTP cyclohydrolase I
MSYYPPSIRPNGFIQTEKKITKTKKMKKKTKAEVKRIAFEVTNLIKIITDDYNRDFTMEVSTEVDKIIYGNVKTKEWFEKMFIEKEEPDITCCGDEITGIVKDIGLCPTCLEHI